MPSLFQRIVCVAAAVAAQALAAQDQRLPVVAAEEHASVPMTPGLVGRLAVFSRYAIDGNNHEIIAIDPSNGRSESLIAPARDARLVAMDDRYIVYTRGGSVARPVVVVDRATGQELASVGLRDRIVFGHIRDDRLILIQNYFAAISPVLVYTLPALELERTTEIAVAHEAHLWGERIVALGNQLAVYDGDLNLIEAVDLPAKYPDINANCMGQSFRIHHDVAIVGSRCFQLAVYDLSTLGLRYTLRGFANFHGFDAIDDLLFVSGTDSIEERLRAYDLRTGRELARLNVAGDVVAASNGRLLMMQQHGSSPYPTRMTVYEPALDAIRSDEARLANVLDGCRPVEGDGIYAAIDACENAGIRAYLERLASSPEPTAALRQYARVLALSYSRFNEAIPILESLSDYPDRAEILAIARLKATQLNAVDAPATGPPAPDASGVTKRPLDFGAFSDVMAFDGDRAYLSRYTCTESLSNGALTFDVLERQSLALVKRIRIAGCDGEYQDNISSIDPIPGYVVLGISYRYDDAARPNVAVIDAASLEVLATNHISAEPGELGEWNGRLLRCATRPNEPHTRLDPSTARLVAASDAEAVACLNGEVASGRWARVLTPPSRNTPLFSTPGFTAYDGSSLYPMRSYRFVATTNDEPRVETVERRYVYVLPVPDKDAVVLGHVRGTEWNWSRFDLETGAEATLVVTNRVADAIAAWRNYLFVAMERDLLIYDLDENEVVYFDRDFIREGYEPRCPTCGIRDLRLDGDRLLVLPLRGDNTRIIDLPVYATNFRDSDLFVELAREQRDGVAE